MGGVKNWAVIVNGIIVERVLAEESFFDLPISVNGSIKSKYPSFIIVDLSTHETNPNVGWQYINGVFSDTNTITQVDTEILNEEENSVITTG